MNKFTKGEWNYTKYSSGDYGIFSVHEEESANDIALVRSRGEETFSNVKLLTYAPELLECCIDILRILELNPTNDNLYQRNKISRLIYKITGE